MVQALLLLPQSPRFQPLGLYLSAQFLHKPTVIGHTDRHIPCPELSEVPAGLGSRRYMEIIPVHDLMRRKQDNGIRLP